MELEQRTVIIPDGTEQQIPALVEPISIVNMNGLEHIMTITKDPIKLSDTSFKTWTPATSQKTIVSSGDAGTFTAEDIDKNDYVVRTRYCFKVVYKDGTAVANGMFDQNVGETWYMVTRRPYDYASLEAKNSNFNFMASVTTINILKYYTGGAWTMKFSTSYGIFITAVAPVTADTSGLSPVVTVKRPQISAQCSNTYFSTAMAANVDQDKSTLTLKYDVYRARGGFRQRDIYDNLIDMWHNGLE